MRDRRAGLDYYKCVHGARSLRSSPIDPDVGFIGARYLLVNILACIHRDITYAFLFNIKNNELYTRFKICFPPLSVSCVNNNHQVVVRNKDKKANQVPRI